MPAAQTAPVSPRIDVALARRTCWLTAPCFWAMAKWQARKHGTQDRHPWRKVPLAMDTTTSNIRALEFIPTSDGNTPVPPERLDQAPEGEEIGTVTGCYDGR